MSQLDLAFAAEVDRTVISRIERGLANPSVLTLATICYALGITLSDLFKDVVEAFPPDQNESRRANAAQPKQVARVRRLR